MSQVHKVIGRPTLTGSTGLVGPGIKGQGIKGQGIKGEGIKGQGIKEALCPARTPTARHPQPHETAKEVNHMTRRANWPAPATRYRTTRENRLLDCVRPYADVESQQRAPPLPLWHREPAPHPERDLGSGTNRIREMKANAPECVGSSVPSAARRKPNDKTPSVRLIAYCHHPPSLLREHLI